MGVANLVLAMGIPVFGPTADGAELEGSKWFAKEFMARHDIPTGAAQGFYSEDEATVYIEDHGAPLVVKADGLAAGKGVTVAMDELTARQAVADSLTGAFGAAGEFVVVEEYLEGLECSLLAFTDGDTVRVMEPATDHKRLLDNDEGPNTGGMGVFSPVPSLRAKALDKMSRILEQTVAALREEGITFRGVLYGGFILTADGPKVLEYNVRFGDPETQVLLPRLKTDLLEIILAVTEGRLADIELEWSDEVAVSVVLASDGYPEKPETGKPISGIEEAERVPGVRVYHAGTTLTDDGTLVSSGGRVLNVTALGADFEEARARAYEAVARISFEGMQFRSDIGLKALVPPPADGGTRCESCEDAG
jgi:phosphoribosylamine--glycine ligase